MKATAAYLAAERDAATKSEWIGGAIVAMAGASYEHNVIAANLLIALGMRLRGSACRAFGSDLRVRANHNMVYPDLSVVCGRPAFTDSQSDTLTNPSVVIEVLSPSTERLGRGEKLRDYQATESVREVVLVAPDRPRVERYERQDGGLWLYEAIEGDAALTIAACGLTIPLAEIYDGVG